MHGSWSPLHCAWSTCSGCRVLRQSSTCRKVSSPPLSRKTSGAASRTLRSAMTVRASSSSTPQHDAQSDAPACSRKLCT